MRTINLVSSTPHAVKSRKPSTGFRRLRKSIRAIPHRATNLAGLSSIKSAIRMPSTTSMWPPEHRPFTHALNAVWRDIGIACWHLGDYENARSALERYAARRQYDPEGLYWLGKALASTNHTDRAVEAWQQAVEAAATMPSHRRRPMMKWARMAKSELKALGRNPS